MGENDGEKPKNKLYKILQIMAHLIDKSAVMQAKEAAQNAFNSLPLETRMKLANGYERLSEVELLLSRGDNLSMATIKKRKRELEQWLLEWYNENKI